MRALPRRIAGTVVIVLESRRAGPWVVGFDDRLDRHPARLPGGAVLPRIALVQEWAVVTVAAERIVAAIPWWRLRWGDAGLLLRLLERDLGPRWRWAWTLARRAAGDALEEDARAS